MIASALESFARQALVRAGVIGAHAPRSYQEGAAVPQGPAVTPRAAAPFPAPTVDDTVAGPAILATPEGHEPGLLADLVGLPLTVENVEAMLDEMVRPALNADGGDIRLIQILEQDVYVKLVGACNTCPSSVMTMRMGVERLLQEEFPEMGELIQVDDDFGA